MKRTTFALVLCLVLVATVAASRPEPRALEMIGRCLILGDIARHDPALGTFVRLVFRPHGQAPVAFVSRGTVGAGIYCPAGAGGSPVPAVRLRYRIIPRGLDGTVPVVALEAVRLVPMARN